MRTAGRLERALAGHARRPRLADIPLKVWRRGGAWMRRHVLRRGSPRKTLAHGGALIALVGGDGAGKSTAAEELSQWLSRDLQTTRVHLGKPRRSAVSRVSKRAWDLGSAVRRSSVSGQSALAASTETSMSFRAYARLAWELMTARDRYRQYVRARRLATNGAIVICDRYPLPQIMLMDGAVATRMLARPGGSRLVRALAELERRYYGQILYPDILIVLRVDPSVAVERKRGEDDEAFVRRRSQEIWAMDWQGTPAVVVDAGRPKSQVLSEIKSLVWSRL
jgi:thymidylate kinase